MTIGENISFGKDNATQEEIEMASRQANAYDFIKDLPEVCLAFSYIYKLLIINILIFMYYTTPVLIFTEI